ncbi:sigma-70 family RNA polymerase sigma factor [Nonomuraea sp. 3-1Str]|uniref:RNA polymerase sigma factor n=1 Tax=unclassified Nonomuraea TaxID=2593643 RepID=UPI002865EBA4|nr:sigma-70 family RNA polymerase sigma factor [Nonomuraea sp. 3-1Str]MDR8411668.1 sigma-70 family RNA polymerase sigma factor [Nonomuraea sp. 3-1Str]
MEPLADCFRTHAPLVRSYLRRLVPPGEIDDVTQVVFIEAWLTGHRYDPARSLEAWLLGIARKRGVDHLRARKATVPLEAAGEPAGDDGRDDSEGLARRDLVRRALSELPAAQREAIALAYYGDLSQREISERLRVPLGTVKARTARGLHRLSALLEAA